VRRLTLLLLLVPAAAQEDGVGRPFWVSTPPAAASASTREIPQCRRSSNMPQISDPMYLMRLRQILCSS